MIQQIPVLKGVLKAMNSDPLPAPFGVKLLVFLFFGVATLTAIGICGIVLGLGIAALRFGLTM